MSDDCGCGTQNEKSVDMFLCVRLRETEREVCRYVSVCAFRGDRVRKAVCVSVRVYARGDVSVCAFGGDRMRKVCLGVCVRGSERDSKERYQGELKSEDDREGPFSL